jgi:predicted dehydrogenase
MLDGLRLNYVKNGRQVIETPDFSTGSVAYFDGDASGDPSDLEMRAWIHAIRTDTEPPTKASQALVVTRILEAIYTSAATGKPVYFED